MRLTIPLAVVLLAWSVGSAAGRQATAEVVGPTAEIPRAGYKTWSLFLVCNPDWVAPDKSADLANLYWRFKSFGDAIGRENLAVWFWKRRLPVKDPQLAENVDVARSAEFCRDLKLRPSEGPFVVVTTGYPELGTFPKDRAFFKLGGLQPADIAKLLNLLTDQLLLQGKVDAPPTGTPAGPPPAGATGRPAPPPPSLWIRLLESARQSLIGFGCNVKLQIDTGLLSAELRECAGF